MHCPGIELQSRGLVDGRELFGLGLQPRDDRFREPVLHTLATTATPLLSDGQAGTRQVTGWWRT